VIVNSYDQVIDSSIHNHPNNEAKIEVMKMKQNIISKARGTSEKSSCIVVAEISNKNEEVLLNCPKYSSMRDSITRIRNKMVNFIPQIQLTFQKNYN
jgi:hypothetical protein